MKDRVARQKNQQQDDRLDALEARVAQINNDQYLDRGSIAEAFARIKALEVDLHDDDAVIDQITGLTAQDAIFADRFNAQSARFDALSARITDLQTRVAKLETPEQPTPPEEPPPPDPPPSEWRTIWQPQTLNDWAKVVDAGTATSPAPGKFRLRIEAPVGSGSHHCELQEHRLSPRGIEIAYDWLCTINPGSVFPTAPSSTTIHQSHADNQTGYGGGILGYRDGRLRLHVRGGKVTDPKGSIHREYEKDFYLDPFRFKIGVPFRIRREVKWDAVHGYSRCFINGEKLHEVLDVPTFPEERAEGSMFRVGFYPGDGEVNPLLDMTVEGLKFEVPQ